MSDPSGSADVEVFASVLYSGMPEQVVEAVRGWRTIWYRIVDAIGLHMVQGQTGGYKSTFLFNIAVSRAVRKLKTVIFSCQMETDVIDQWLLAILSNIPVEDLKRVLIAGDSDGRLSPFRTFLAEYIKVKQTINVAGNLIRAVEWGIEQGYKFIVIDGVDSYFATISESRRTAIEGELSDLAAFAKEHEVTICLNSQIKVGAYNREVVTLDDSSESGAKSTEVVNVVALSTRIRGSLINVVVNKSRHNSGPDFETCTRFTVNPSRRLEPLRGGQLLDQQSLYPTDIRTPTYVNNKPGDLPGEGSSEHSSNTVNPTAPSNLLTNSGGMKGFIPLGRGIFGLAMFANRDWEAVGCLVDLYGRAQIGGGKQMYAPGTGIPVSLERGDVLVSNNMLAKMWETSQTYVRDFLARAEREGAITLSTIDRNGARKPANQLSRDASSRSFGTVVTLCHYMPLPSGHAKAGSKKNVAGPGVGPVLESAEE